MRKIRDVLRLNLGEGLSRRTVGAAVGLPYTTVADYLVRARAAGLTWPLPEAMDDADLEARLFPAAPRAAVARPPPDFGAVHTELRRKGVTLELLWVEYRERHPDGYGYSQFCNLYRQWQRRVDVVMRQEHRAGEKLFVDFAGQTVPVVDPGTGEILQAQIFVAVLGASSYTYAEAVPSQALPHWVGAHVRAFAFFGGCPRLLVPDYVARHIIGVLCPTGLCGRRDRGAPSRSWDRACAAGTGHITIRVRPASSGGTRRSARSAWCGMPP
jgi:transposase